MQRFAILLLFFLVALITAQSSSDSTSSSVDSGSGSGSGSGSDSSIDSMSSSSDDSEIGACDEDDLETAEDLYYAANIEGLAQSCAEAVDPESLTDYQGIIEDMCDEQACKDLVEESIRVLESLPECTVDGHNIKEHVADLANAIAEEWDNVCDGDNAAQSTSISIFVLFTAIAIMLVN